MDASLPLALARGLGAAATALPDGPVAWPASVRVLFALLLAAAAAPGAVAELLAAAAPPAPVWPGLPDLARELLVGAGLGFCFSLPFRALEAAAPAAGGAVVPGGEGLGAAAALAGATGFVAAGGAERLLVAFMRAPATGLPEPGVALALGKAAFGLVGAALVPALGFALGLRLFLALAGRSLGPLGGLPGTCLAGLAGLVFARPFLAGLAAWGGEALRIGLAAAAGS